MSAKHYPEVNPNPDFPAIEKSVLAFWEREKLFARSVSSRPTDNEFIFYDGPPFANGLPHYGHLLTGYVKDLFARYQTMKGKRVDRRFGWDCHGLPAEMGSEKELGISGRQAIQNFGIGKFNEHCRTSVMKYTKEWEDYVTRQARWVDFKNDYKTMDKNFMESVLWAFKRLYDKGLIFEAHRVMPYSWAAETPLSNFETKLDNSYREREDKAITVAFELNTPPNILSEALDIVYHPDNKSGEQVHKGNPFKKYFILAWTTTPWTLPSNLALAISQKVQYQAFYKDDAVYIASKNYLHSNSEELKKAGFEITFPKCVRFGDNPNSDGTIIYVNGEHLLNLSYHPLFPYFASHKHSFRILDGSSFVSDGDGTGIVHMAPGFGEDDQKVCEANGIEIVVPVDGRGKFTDAIFDLPDLKLQGLNVIAENVETFKFGEANERIITWLKNKGQLIKQEQIKHNYPHCWRTDTPLIYRAMPSWYVEVTKFRDRAVELNKQINWIPEHIRDGQMGHMLATAPDWSISRNRFWGTPIPVWRSKSGKIKVIGSIAELEQCCGHKVEDLHRPYIDEIVIREGGEEYRRVEDVFDCWFESGSMPFAQVHYPFENKDWFDAHFPADFITEYVGQTRGWFNTLIMLATALFDKPPFKNCICHGVVLDSETGLKYSKRLKNYRDPMEVMDKYGADALRWLMIASPVMRGLDLMVDPEGKFIRDVVRLHIKPIWNAYNFFCLYANADGVKARLIHPHPPAIAGPPLSLTEGEGTSGARGEGDNIMDRYILAKCCQAVETIEKSLDAYDTPGACEAVSQFFESLNNWYIRRNKERFWKEEKDADKQAAYDTLYTVLTTMCRAAAPLLPLTCEEIYRGLTESSLSPRERVAPQAPGEGKEYANKKLIENARELRKKATDAEQLVWNILRDRQLENKKFRRQHPLGNYVLDFYCEADRLAIELDGGQHTEQKAYDDKRTAFLNAEGIRVLRFWNNDVLTNIEGVVETILSALPSPQPSPGGRGSISVHLTSYPSDVEVPEKLEINFGGMKVGTTTTKLLVVMDRLQSICSTALAIRSARNIRVRQPLARLTILQQDEVDLFNPGFISDLIKDEINVKAVTFEQRNVKDIANYILKLNNPVLGKRLPEKMKQIIPASKKGEWKSVDGTVEICGEKLLPGEYTLQLEPKPEYKDRAQALSTNDALVILDTTVTPELEAEGIARDLVRMIQQARKDAGLHVSDRITLALDAPAAIARAAQAHGTYIEQQTLSASLGLKLPAKADYISENTLDDQKVVIAISKCA